MATKINLRMLPSWDRPPTGKAAADDFSAVFLNFSEQVPMTIRERRELRKWTKFSNAPFGNPWGICDDTGWEMNFIDAYRIVVTKEIDDYLGYDPDDTREGVPF